MSRFEEMKKANAQLPFYSVLDPEFAKYGRVITENETAMCELVKKNIPMPEAGSSYVTFTDVLDQSDVAKEYNDLYCGQLDEQWGLCWGHNSLMNALEWHTCNEFNIGVTDMVLLLAKRADMEDGKLDAKKVVAFYLPAGCMIEVFSDSLHYCPCEVDANGFYCVVGLQRGTNEAVDETRPHDPILTAANKWLIPHADMDAKNPLIFGENWKVNTL